MEILVHKLDEQLGITNENITDLIKHTIKKIKLDIHSCQVIFVVGHLIEIYPTV